ncbi:hypothetical protein VQ7734_05123 [Vibrio quintilis]|uniref:Uncharacterized protein n=1 Tax=Vibrio quintilis TaxID=1117707 RepID=A0A1M7Z2Z9_9VIBR|nr:hypothetical protein VQ7734_05123 [Vibrio quintilis]
MLKKPESADIPKQSEDAGFSALSQSLTNSPAGRELKSTFLRQENLKGGYIPAFPFLELSLSAAR